jgi:ATP-dependent exoDNAse (exonuclease V) beta subunit
MAERPFEIKIHTHPLTLVQDPERVRLAQRGEIIHRALSLLEHCTRREDMERALLRAFALEGVDQARWAIEQDFLNPLWAALSLPEVRPWFARGVRNLREAEVIDAQGELHRIDRLIIGENELAVIDFKVARREEGHREQVGLYQRIAEAVFHLPVKGSLLYIDEPAVVALP